MDARFRIGTPKTINNDDGHAVELKFETIEDIIGLAEVCVTQGYVVTLGIGELDE